MLDIESRVYCIYWFKASDILYGVEVEGSGFSIRCEGLTLESAVRFVIEKLSRHHIGRGYGLRLRRRSYDDTGVDGKYIRGNG